MRVLLIRGSWQPGSSNSAVIDVVAGRLASLGVEATAFDALRDIAPFDPALVDEPARAVAELRRSVEEADAVVIAAPEYAGAVAGSVKNALDWLVGAGSMWDRAVGVACAGTTGGWFARRDLVQTLSWHGALVVAHLGIRAPRTKSDDAGRFSDPATIDQIVRFTADVVAGPRLTRAERIVRARAIATEFSLDPTRVAGGVGE